MHVRTGTLVGALLAVALAGPAASHASGRLCPSDKANAAGKESLCRARCDAAAMRSGSGPSSDCHDRCRSKLGLAWARADRKGDCIVAGDEGAVADQVGALVVALEGTLGLAGRSACTGKQYQYAGRRASCRLKCHATAIRQSVPVSSACLDGCDRSFQGRCLGANAAGGCLVPVSCAGVASTVDAFVDGTVTALLTATTTTTTSTTTPPTSTTAPACIGCVADGNGNGVREWMMVGDSNTTFIACAYPIVLQSRYDPLDVTILDEGDFGSSAASWVAGDVLAPLLAAFDPDAVLISLGTNDIVVGTAEAAWANLQQLYDQAAAWCHANGDCVVPFVATVPPIYSPPDPVDYNPEIQALNALIRASVPAERVVDFDSWMPATWDASVMWRDTDGRHLGCGGHAIRADVCEAVLDRTP